MPLRFLRSLLAATLVALTAACSHMPSGEPDAALANRNNGVIAASVTLKKGTQTMDSWFYIRKKGETDKDKNFRLSANKPFSSGLEHLATLPIIGSGKPTFANRPDRTGRVVAVSVEPGEYELYTWTLYISIVNGYGYISPKTPPPPLSFTVKPGEVTYLGSLHGETLMGRNIIGLPVPGDGLPELRDESERDIPMLKGRFPMIADWAITPARLDGASWLPPLQP